MPASLFFTRLSAKTTLNSGRMRVFHEAVEKTTSQFALHARFQRGCRPKQLSTLAACAFFRMQSKKLPFNLRSMRVFHEAVHKNSSQLWPHGRFSRCCHQNDTQNCNLAPRPNCDDFSIQISISWHIFELACGPPYSGGTVAQIPIPTHVQIVTIFPFRIRSPGTFSSSRVVPHILAARLGECVKNYEPSSQTSACFDLRPCGARIAAA